MENKKIYCTSQGSREFGWIITCLKDFIGKSVSSYNRELQIMQTDYTIVSVEGIEGISDGTETMWRSRKKISAIPSDKNTYCDVVVAGDDGQYHVIGLWWEGVTIIPA